MHYWCLTMCLVIICPQAGQRRAVRHWLSVLIATVPSTVCASMNQVTRRGTWTQASRRRPCCEPHTSLRVLLLKGRENSA